MPLRRAPLVAWLALSAVLANKDSPNSKFPHTFQVRPELEQAAPAPPSKAVCLRDRDYICNRHNPRFLCTCYQANNHHVRSGGVGHPRCRKCATPRATTCSRSGT